MMSGTAWAGHAGDMDIPVVLPHELFGWLVGLSLLLVAVLGLAGLLFWRLHRVERRLRALEPPSVPSRGNPADTSASR
ncbi:MAG: hypothetical protein ACREI3_05135 [Nitrospirales bacterium]